MQTARRIYVYLMTGVGLGAGIAGLTMLLGVVLDQLGLGPQGEVLFGGDETLRQQLTVATALVAVSLPVWLVHWFLAERSVRPDRPDGLLELNAPERGLFFALVLGALLVVGATGVASAIEGIILRVVDADASYRDVAGDLARGSVALAAWGYHIRVRGRDWRRRTLTHQAAFLPRAYRYVAAVVGLVVMLAGITGLLELLGRILVDEPLPVFGDPGPWWAFQLATTTSAILVGGGVWIGHWIHAGRLVADPGPRGESERASRLRLAAFVAVLVIAAAGTLIWLGTGIGEGIALLLGVSETTRASEAIGAVVVPLFSALPYAAIGWIHARWLDGESVAVATESGAATVDRLRIYPVALVGLIVGAVGAAWLVDVVIDALFGPTGFGSGEVWRRQLAQFAPYAALGSAAWIWRWFAGLRRSSVDPAGEAESTTRRGALLIALGGGILAGIGATGFILYRLFGSLFGVTLTGDTISALSLPIGILLVAVAVAVYHGIVLRRDGERREGAADHGPAAPAGRTVRLRLTGPEPGLDAALAALGSATPPGYALELEREDVPGD